MPSSLPAPPAFALRVASRSDVGMRRATNQDSLAVSPDNGSGTIVGDALLMVADGMGAHAAGELASKMATDSIPHTFCKTKGEAAPAALRQAIRDANHEIHAKGSSSPDFHGMGTTCSCLVITQGSALVGHVGDSRVYRLREATLEQLTFDHSLVWEMAAASNVTEDKVPSCIPKNVITRSLGPHEAVNVDLEGPHPLQASDTFLLCSDGLTGVVDDQLAGAVLATMDPDDAAQTLVDLANLRGGPDNITVVVARVESQAEASAPCPLNTEKSLDRVGLGVFGAAACLLACGWSLWKGNVTGMLTAAAGLGAAIAYAFSGRPVDSANPSAPLPLGGPYGNGPYRRVDCGDQAGAAGTLRTLVQELSELDSSEDTVSTEDLASNGAAAGFGQSFLIDWSAHRQPQQEADAAFEAGDFRTAIAGYANVMRSVVQAIRDDDGTHRYKASSELLS